MKTKHLLISLLFIFSLITLQAKPTKIATPLYLGLILVDECNVESMAELCDRYNLTREPDEDGFTVYTYTDGTLIRFKFDQLSSGRKIPRVEIQTNENNNTIEEMLTLGGYIKTSQGYIKGNEFAMRRNVAKVSSRKPCVITFTKIYRE